MPKKVNNKYTGSYFGSQGLKSFPAELTAKAKELGNFTDITAGGAGYPYKLATEGVSVHVNDRNYYATANQKVIFGKYFDYRYRKESWFEDFCFFTHPSHTVSIPGYFSEKLENNKYLQKYFSKDIATYVDSVLYHDDYILRAIIGRSLVTTFTFRNRDWCNKTSKGIQTTEITPEDFWKTMMRAAWRLRLFAENIHNVNTYTTIGDAKDAIGKIPQILDPEKTVVYTDPAWPWRDKFKISKNPYKFFTCEIGSILEQKDIKDIPFWDPKDDERTMRDVVSWIDKAFDMDIPYFCLSTQSTNAPEPEWMYEELTKKYKMEWLEKVPMQSLSAHGLFYEYFGMFKNEK